MSQPSIGGRLKSAREAKGMNLQEASQATKVQRKILEAIEEDRVEEVLDLTYAKIFLKKYASFLGVDGLSLVEEYQSLHGPVPEHPIAPKPAVENTSSFSSLRNVLVPASIALVALIGIAFIGYLALDLYSTLKHAKSPAAKAVPQKGRSHGVRNVVEERSEPATAKPRPVQRQPAVSSKQLVPRPQPLRLTVRAKADVWMQVKSDGTIIFQNVLPKGSHENWTAQEELELWTGNAAAMELQLNGTPLDNLGSGVKKGIKVTRDGLKVPG